MKSRIPVSVWALILAALSFCLPSLAPAPAAAQGISIQIKRSATESGIPTLADGQLCFATDTGRLFIGTNGAGNKLVAVPMQVQTAGTLVSTQNTLNFTGSGVTVTNDGANSRINIAIPGATGSVTSAAASGGSTGLTFSGSPITTSGTFTLGGTLAIASGGTGATSSGAALTNLGGVSTSRLVSTGTGLAGGGDLTANRTLSLANTTVTAGSYTNTSITVDAQGRLTAASNGSAGSSGTVTSVGLSAPSIFSISGSPVTSSGTLTLSLATQTANTLFAGPSSGSASAPAFRGLVPLDYPAFVASGASHARGAVPDPGSTSGTTKFLREDATWAVPPSGGSIPSGTSNQTLRYSGSTLTATSFLTNDEATVTINPAGDTGTGDGVTRLWVRGQAPSGYPNNAAVVIGDDGAGGIVIPSALGLSGPVTMLKVMGTGSDTDIAALLTNNGGYGLLAGMINSSDTGHEHFTVSGNGAGGSLPLLLQKFGGNVGIGYAGSTTAPRMPTEPLEVFGNCLADLYKVYGIDPMTLDPVVLTGYTGNTSSGLVITGGLVTDYTRPAGRTISAAETLTTDDYGKTIFLAASTSFTVTLPTASGAAGERITVKKKGVAYSSGHTVAAQSGETIDGAGSATLSTGYQHQTYESDGANWWIVGG